MKGKEAVSRRRLKCSTVPQCFHVGKTRVQALHAEKPLPDKPDVTRTRLLENGFANCEFNHFQNNKIVMRRRPTCLVVDYNGEVGWQHYCGVSFLSIWRGRTAVEQEFDAHGAVILPWSVCWPPQSMEWRHLFGDD